MQIIAAAFFSACCLIAGMTFVLGRKRVAKNLNMTDPKRIMPNATPRSVARTGWLLLAGAPIIWLILWAGTAVR